MQPNAAALDQAIACFQNNQAPQAIEKCRALLAAQPDNALAWQVLGLAVRRIPGAGDPLPSLRRAIYCDANHTVAYYTLATTRISQGPAGAADAVRLLRHAISLTPTFPEALESLSDLLDAGKKGAPEHLAAARLIERLAQLYPEDARLHMKATSLHRKTQANQLAYQRNRLAVALEPDNPHYNLSLAERALFARNYKRALRHMTYARWKLADADSSHRASLIYSYRGMIACALGAAVDAAVAKDGAEAFQLQNAITHASPAAGAATAQWIARAVSGEWRPPPPHPIFNEFHRSPERFDNGFAINFMGTRRRQSFDSHLGLHHPLQLASGGMEIMPGVDLPVRPSEDYFEWIDVLCAARYAQKRLVVVELGAGYGRWLAHAYAAAQRRRDSAPLECLLIGVEADAKKIENMRRHLADNGVPPTATRLLHCAVSDFDGELHFAKTNAASTFGTQVAAGSGENTESVPAMRLSTLLPPEIGVIDLIDMDIQGEEWKVLADSATLVNERVKRLHIATHGRDIEAKIAELLENLGWLPSAQLTCQALIPNMTPDGPLCCNDGVQSWVNPRLTPVHMGHALQPPA